MTRPRCAARVESPRRIGHDSPVPSLYTFVALSVCLDTVNRVLLARESRPDCRGQFYVPAGRGNPGEDPLGIARRITAEKTGLSVEPLGILGVVHNPPVGKFPGQLRVFVRARPQGGVLKTVEDRNSMGAVWAEHDRVRDLKLRSDDFVSWLEDAVLGQAPILPTAFWRTIGSAG